MAGVNKVILIGNLGRDPEVRHLESGVPVASFSLATSETYNDRNTGEKKTITEWHNVVLWRKLAEIAERYLHKGDQVYIEGKLRTRQWEKDGVTRYTTEIVGDTMTMLGSRPKTDDYQQGAQPAASQPAATPAPAEKTGSATDTPVASQPDSGDAAGVDDDLPF